MINDLRSGMSIYKSLWAGSISIILYNSDVNVSVEKTFAAANCIAGKLPHADHVVHHDPT